MLSLFDCLAEGIATLFVFGHVSGHLALIKSSGSHFQFCANAAINPRFLMGKVLIDTVDTTSPMHLLINSTLNQRIHQCYCPMLCGTYPSPRDRSNLETWSQIGRL